MQHIKYTDTHKNKQYFRQKDYTTFADSCWKITSEVSSELKNDATKLIRLHHSIYNNY